ncbi:unnamed protein product [Paramecium sonneborni]|uniref:Protein kinase domain-containing protein n=1 Tax=Paramecium sonneborni TaxID=65129 RepID=A0A8S1QUH6_9CILI|nr:unnamed protein product [Paramecium sonneborni]
MNNQNIDIEFLDSDNEEKVNENKQQIKQQSMQIEEAPSQNIFQQNSTYISRTDIITAIEHIVTKMLKGTMKQIRPTDVKNEPILSTSVQKACCLISVDDSIIKQLKEYQIPLQFSDKDRKKGLTVIFEFNEFNQCDLLSNGKFAKEFSVLRPHQETQRFTSIILAINKMDQQIYAIKKGRIQLVEIILQSNYLNQRSQSNVKTLTSKQQEINQKNQKYFYLYLRQEYDSYLGCNDLLQFSVKYLLNMPLELKRKTMKSLINQLISGLEYIHCQGFFHRDLKLENVLVTKDNAGDVALKFVILIGVRLI